MSDRRLVKTLIIANSLAIICATCLRFIFEADYGVADGSAFGWIVQACGVLYAPGALFQALLPRGPSAPMAGNTLAAFAFNVVLYAGVASLVVVLLSRRSKRLHPPLRAIRPGR